MYSVFGGDDLWQKTSEITLYREAYSSLAPSAAGRQGRRHSHYCFLMTFEKQKTLFRSHQRANLSELLLFVRDIH